MAACKSEYGLLDLPAELLDLIISYLPDVELMNVRKTSVQFEDSFQRRICRKGSKLNFSRCFRLQEEDLLQLLRLGKDYITSININHCYWIQKDCLELIMRLPKLQELHVIDCRISTSQHKELIPVGLSALSISWSSISGLRFMGIGDKYASKLFGNLKRLTLNVSFESRWDQRDFIEGIVPAVLRHCLQLESLKIYESSDVTNFFSHSSFDFQQGLLPNLSKLHLHLNLSIHNSDCVIELVTAIFRQRKTLLNEVYLGKASYSLLESSPELYQLILPCINAEEIPVVCLDSHDHRCPELPAIPKIWMDRKTPKCKVVSLQGLSLKSMSATSTLVAELGPQLQELNLRNCQVDINDLSTGLTTIAKLCTRLNKLDLTLHSSIVTNGDSNDELLISISKFKALKVLYMSVGLLSRSNNTSSVASVSGHQKSSIGSQMEISEESMRGSPLWRLTQCCREINDFRISNDKWVNYSVVCESTIACISNWKNLKELHLVNIPTVGRGSFLPFITKNCSQLTDLYLGNVCRLGPCDYTRSLIDSLSYATDLKDLSIIQDFELSSMLWNALGNCKSLERVYLNHLVIKPEECNGFIKMLIELPKLVLVSVKTKLTPTAVVESIVGKIGSLRSTRPALSYCFDSKAEVTPRGTISRSCRLMDADVHLELACYKTVCENSSEI